MNEPESNSPTTDSNQVAPTAPRANVKRMRRPFPLVWIVPLIAAAVTFYYWKQHRQERGPEIVVRVNDASGVRSGETAVTVRGVRVGTVETAALTNDGKRAELHIRLNRSADPVATKGTVFWLVRPDISGGNIGGLGTVITGPYVEAIPGGGEPATEFDGLERAPVMLGDGVRFILHADRLERLQIDSPVYYRGIQVGAVQDVRLASDSTQVNVTIFIWKRYAELVHDGTRFWSVAGADISGGLFTGVKFQLESLRTIVAGAVAFATPTEGMGSQAVDGAGFTLHPEPKKDWLTWAPSLTLSQPPATAATENVNAAEALDGTAKSAARVP